MIEEQLLQRKHEQYQLSVEEYKAFRRDGYLLLRGLVTRDEARELAQYTEEHDGRP